MSPFISFMLDFENSLLEGWQLPVPTGPYRYLDPEWAELVRRNVAPYHSDVSFEQYKQFCEAGFGDEWFQE